MENGPPMSWTPTVLFTFLGLYFMDKALRKKARRSWGWGRTGEGAPISRTGYFVLAATFLDIGAMLAWSPGSPPITLIVLFGFCFLAILVSGFVDTRTDRRRTKDGENNVKGNGNGKEITGY